jgi:hypothetical protein
MSREKDSQANTIRYLEEQLKEKSVENEIFKEILAKKQEELDMLHTRKDANMRVSHSALFKINTANDNVPKCSECNIF